MAYTDIVAIDRPDSAKPGTTVTIKPYVKNLWSDYLYALVTGKYDNTEFYFYPEYQVIAPQGTEIFSGSFTMPDKNTRVYIWSYYWTGTKWYLDDEAYVDISKGAWVELALTTVGIKCSVLGMWIPLAEATKSLNVSVAFMWVPLAQTTLTITSLRHNWIELGQSSVNIKALPPIKEKYAWLPWLAGAGAIGLAIYAVKKGQE